MPEPTSPRPIPPGGGESILAGVPADDVRAIAEAKIANLEVALKTARTIGMAIGILMERNKLSECEAFAMLVGLSQRIHRKIKDIAAEVVYTGQLPGV